MISTFRRDTGFCTIIVVTSLAMTFLCVSSSAQSVSANRARYKLIDLGTLGGPISYGSSAGDGTRLLNNAGVVSTYADTSLPDPFAPDFCFVPDCQLAHAYRWQNGVMTDLGSIEESFNSSSTSINDRGWSLGASQTSNINSGGFPPPLHATLWIRGRIIDLGVVPGGSNSLGFSVNNAGQAVGISDNGIPDPFSEFGVQIRTFLWEKGELRDIGTLGGPDAGTGPGCNNQRPGVIVGWSYTSFTHNETTGIPTQDPFLWDNGRMQDLGSLGGTVSSGQCANNRGEVIGVSNLPGDSTFHAFRWRNGKMGDLGTLGGDNSEAIWINDSGVIAGTADLPTPGIHDAVRWKDGQILDLGTVEGDACSRGRAINSKGQIVGGSSDCHSFLHAFVWQEGGPMLDLNTLIPPGSGLQLTNAININDRGEILAKSDPLGVTPIDDEDLGHLVLLVPCDEGRGDCVNELAASNATVFSSSQMRGGQQLNARKALSARGERLTGPATIAP